MKASLPFLNTMLLCCFLFLTIATSKAQNPPGTCNTYYADADQDGYGDPETSVQSCAGQPEGYVTNANDCDDSLSAINPGEAEVLYNGIDENCNGTMDEGYQIKTKLLSTHCGISLSSMNSIIGIKTISSAITRYRIKATAGNLVQTIERGVPHFNMAMFASYSYNTMYTIEIEVQRYGVWLGYYGEACTVSTPGYNNTFSMVSPACGSLLPQLSTTISTANGVGVTGYRFKVTNLSDPFGPYAEQTVTRALNWFNLTMLTRYNYGTNYRIEVAVKTIGDYGPYGAACEVSSPAAPVLINCGGNVASSSTPIGSHSVVGVIYYRFQIVRATDLAMVTIDRNMNYFSFNNLPAFIKTGGCQYYVRVAVMTTGYWSPFGDVCEIMAPAGIAKDSTEEDHTEQAMRVLAYPNPFRDDFQISVQHHTDALIANTQQVTVKVYDLLGKPIESRILKKEELETAFFGTYYAPGVYSMVIESGTEPQIIRVLKK